MTRAKIEFTRQEKLLLALMAVVQFSHIVDFMILMPLGPQLIRLFEITPQQFGLLVSSYTFSAGVMGFLASFFVDRYDRKTSLLIFVFGFAVGTLACAIAPNYWTLLIARCVAGAFGGVLGSLVLSIVSDAINYERRGTALGIVMGAFSVASVVGVPFSLYLANWAGWHAPFVFLGVLGLLTMTLMWFQVPSMRGHLNSGKPRHKPLESLTHILASPHQVLALGFMFLLVMGQFTIIPYLSPSFVANAGLPEAQLPLIYLFGGLCSMVASPTIGRLSDRFGKKKVFLWSVMLSMLPMAWITNLGPSPIWLTLAISSSFFIVMSGRMVPAMAMVSSAATPEYRGSFMSIMSSVQQLSAGLGSLVAGAMITSGPSGELIGYPGVGAIALFFSFLAFLAAFKLHAD